MKQERFITLLGFLGQEEISFGKYFAPLLNIRIEEHVSQISCKIGPLETGVDLLISRGWFMVEYLIGFEGNEIQVKQDICDPESIVSYDETILDDEEVLLIGPLTATQALNSDELKELVPSEYHRFMNLFGEPLAQELPSHQSFDHQT
jgi:hypothetical protein